MTTREKSDAFLAHIGCGLAPRSKVAYAGVMRNFLLWYKEERDPATLTSAEAGQWMHWLFDVRGNGAGKVKFHIQLLKRFLTWLEDQGLAPVDHRDILLARKLPKFRSEPKPIRVLTSTQHAQMLRVARQGDRPIKRWWETALIVFWHTGLRFSDVIRLRWDQCDFSEEIINVIPVKTKCSGKEARIPMDPILADHLRALRVKPYYESEWVIPDMYGYSQMGCGRKMLNKWFKVICKRAGYPELHSHLYRHAFDSRLVNAGVNPVIVSAITGQSVQTIQRYSHVDDTARREAMAKARQAMHQARLYAAGIAPIQPLEEDPAMVAANV